MNKPDLHELAREAEAITGRLELFRDALREAYEAALGESDPQTDEETVAPSGDPYVLFEQAKDKAWAARMEIDGVAERLATVQGYRDFIEAGTVEVSW